MMKKNPTNPSNKKVVLKTRDAIIQVDIECITFITCDAYLSTLHFLDNRKPISASKLLKELEMELAPHGFFRVSRNTLVNIKNVYSFQNDSSRLITMVNNDKVCVSFRKISKLKKALGRETKIFL